MVHEEGEQEQDQGQDEPIAASETIEKNDPNK